ncbi:DUF6313 family protein [Streptomyces sp. NPDC003343]
MTALPPEPPPPAPPPRPSIGHQVAVLLAHRHALGRLPYWLLTRATVVLSACAALFVLNGVIIGWADAYEVLVGITSPAKVKVQWAAWPLSIVGWAAIPAFIGGAVGYLINGQIQAHQSQDFNAVLNDLRALIQPPAGPGDGA